MTYKERTSEFNSIVQQTKQKKEAIPSSIGIRTNKQKKPNEKSQFFKIASQLGKDIGATAEKLERLSKLAKTKSLFADPAIEIAELTSIINQDIKNLNNQIGDLKSSAAFNNRNKNLQQHTETVVDSLSFQLRRTTKDFTQVLEIRTENLKTQQKEKENFTGSMSPTLSSRRAVSSPLYKPHSPLNLSLEEGSSSNNEIVINMPQQTMLMTQDRYVASRAEAVVNIERVMTELQGVFMQLNQLVLEQGEMLNRIDMDIDETSNNTRRGQEEIWKYWQYASSNRWLIVKMFLVLLFFSVLFIVFFV